MKEKILDKMFQGTKYEMTTCENTWNTNYTSTFKNLYDFHNALYNQDTIKLYTAMSKIDVNSYLAKGDGEKHRIIHNGVVKLVTTYNKDKIFELGIKSDDDYVSELLEKYKSTFEESETIMSALGSAYIRFSWQDKSNIQLEVFKPSQIKEKKDGFEYEFKMEKYSIIEKHTTGQVEFFYKSEKTTRKFSEQEKINLLTLGFDVEDYVTNLSFPTIIKLSNNNRHPKTNQAIGDLWMCEQLIDELYQCSGCETRMFKMGQDKFVYNELFFSKTTSGNMFLNTNNDVFIGGQFGDLASPITQVSLDPKVSLYDEKYNIALARLLSVAGYSPTSFDLSTNVGANASSQAIEVRESKSISMIKNKKENWKRYIDVMMSMILEIEGKSIDYEIAFIEQGVSPVELKNTLFGLYDRMVINGDELKQALLEIGLL